MTGNTGNGYAKITFIPTACQHNYVDGICTNVKRIRDLVYDRSNAGEGVIIIGKYGKGIKPMHPEVYGVCGWCKDAILIEDEEDLKTIYERRLL